MLVSRGRNPSAAEVITQVVQNPELRNRVLTTLGLLMLVRLGIYIPCRASIAWPSSSSSSREGS